ncbi:hypothetical protein HanRHA438_Chr10g0464481 [Helianthus annuus]|nr:hypothetical protein HanHA89_Chr10g0393351 [Helianthus annuus]KAJ0880557.1 hypothetical protein HanRHA438_Chr10g0464481 [Helianthus annuus]KAJ0884621.1 hypothetical protein HanPSC8_Chr10g0435891 [Helianthus annuus]
MRKLYNHTKGKIHPSPSPTTTPYHHLSLLPLAIATLAATLPPQDQQVLAYLLSISATTTTGKPSTKSAGKPTTGADHPPQFNCNCFRCYTSFWVRWDASPNRKVIHEIIDAYEDGLVHNKKNGKNKKERKNNKCLSSSSSSSSSSSCSSSSSGLHAPPAAAENMSCEPLRMEQSRIEGEDEVVTGLSEKGSVRKIVNFIGERIWGVWGV